jgi:hypothetical protein
MDGTLIIEQEKVAVVGIMHMNKNQLADAIYQISGSAAWVQVPRVIWMIAQDREDSELRWFLAMKNNTIPEIEKREAEFGFRIQENHIMVALEAQPISAEEAVAPEAPEDAKKRRGKLKDAIAFLEQLKAEVGVGGEVPVKDIQQAFPGISDPTWHRARKKLGLETKQRPEGWVWLF